MILEISALERFWWFCRERHAIYERRQAGQPWPWTTDKVLQEYYFCNIYRKLDRHSAWLIENVIEPNKEKPSELLMFNICLFRLFNWIPTYEAIGWQEDYQANSVYPVLNELYWNEKQIYTNAYMVRGFAGKRKFETTLAQLRRIWADKHEIVLSIYRNNSLRIATEAMTEYRGIGGFTAYELATDFTYCDSLLPHPLDGMTWANFGPGASQGLRVLVPTIRPASYLAVAQYLLEASEDHLRSMPPMVMRDVEHSLCEFFKYERGKANGHLKRKYKSHTKDIGSSGC